MTTTARPASDRQIAYLTSLLRQILDGGHVVGLSDDFLAYVTGRVPLEGLTTVSASDLIDQAKGYVDYLRENGYVARPRRGERVDRPAPEVGFYLRDGVVYRVVENREKTRRYAKSLNFASGRWDYARGVVSELTPQDRLTVERAAELGHHHGICVCCGAELSDPESVERGIGPVCARKHFGA